MKKIIPIFFFLCAANAVLAQESINDLLAAGINDAKQFTASYLTPATDGVAYSINSGWFNNAKTPKRLSFEISLIANASFIKDTHKSFEMRISDYENVRFKDGSSVKNVATALGENKPDVVVVVTYDDPIFGNQEVELTLPNGIGASGVNLIPTAFLQASFSPFRGTQLRGRYFPKINQNDVKLGMYGIGLQQEITKLLPADKLLPVAISALVAYTHLDGSYDFTEQNIVAGENQQTQTKINSMLYQVIVGTRLKVANAFAAIGYIDANSKTNLLGTYRVTNGILFSEEIKDPFSVKSKTTGITTTLGGNLQLGIIGIHASYTFATFNSANAGINFTF